MNVKGEMIFANVSAVVSAGDGVQYDVLAPQPPVLPTGTTGISGVFDGTNGVSAPMYNGLELIRRIFTNVTSPSCTIAVGGSNGSIALNFGAQSGILSGMTGMLQGVPWRLNGLTGRLSVSPTSAMSTASNTIRKVLVCIGFSAMPNPGISGLTDTAGTLQLTYGSAFRTSALACVSGDATSYFDLVPWPLPSANEVPVAGLNVPNSFTVSATISAAMLYNDLRVFQGINLSAMIPVVTQP